MVRALILAGGGFGKRLQPLTLDRPKPLIEVGGKPILQWQIEWLSRQGIKDIVLAVGYLRLRSLRLWVMALGLALGYSTVLRRSP